MWSGLGLGSEPYRDNRFGAFQASDGNTPALIADFNNNRYFVPALGPELVTNGTFDADTTPGPPSPWTTSATTSQAPVVSGRIRPTANGSGTGRVVQAISTVPGKLYQFSVARWKGTATGSGIYIGVSASTITGAIYSLSNTTDETTVGYFTATLNTHYVMLDSTISTNGVYAEFDNVSVREVLLGDVGSELITNGDFASGTGWALLNPGTSTATVSGGTLNLTGDGTNAAEGRQSFATEVGATYTLIAQVASSAVSIFVGTTAGGVNIIPATVTSAGWAVYSFVATTTTTWVNFYKQTAALTTVDNVSIRKWTARPSLRAATFDEMFTYTATSTTARSYIDAAGVMKTDLSANAPRFTWQNGKRQLILENQAINYCQQSTLSSVSAVSGGSRSTVSGVYGLNGALFTEDAATSSHFIQPLGNRTVTVGMNYTMSAIVRGTGRSLVQYTFSTISFPAGQWCNFDLTGAGTVSATGGTGTIRPLTGQWAGYYYVTFTATATIASVALGQFATITSMADTRMPSVAGLNAGAYEIYAYQMEENVTVASSHIPTSGTIVTRAIESCQFSPLALAVIGRPAISGAVQATGYRAGTSGSDVPVYWGNSGSRWFAGSRSSTVARFWDNATSLDITPMSNYPTVPFRHSFTLNSSGGRAAINNTLSPSSSTATTAAMTRTLSYIGRSETTSGPVPGDGVYDNAVLYPTRVSDTALQAMGVVQ